MSASSSSDCYLCGASNEPDASFCTRCNGQILRIPDEPDASEPPEVDTSIDVPAEQPEPAPEPATKPRVRRQKGSVQDQRLSDALGLADDVSSIDADLVDTVVTSIPRATPSAEIPMLGTRAGAIPQSSMGSSEFGPRTYALLGLLVLAVAWLGFVTLTGDKDSTPDSIAFTGTTVPPATSSTTTEKPERVWSSSDVEARYSFAFVRVDLITCATEDVPQEMIEAAGVNLNARSIVFDGSEMPNADYAIIKNRTGSRRLAIIERTNDGVFIATSRVSSSQNLEIDPSVEPAESSFFVAYNPSNNTVTTTETLQNLPVQVEAGANGEPLAIHFDDQVVPTAPLGTVDKRVETNPDVDVPADPTTCAVANSLQISGVTETLQEATSDEQGDE